MLFIPACIFIFQKIHHHYEDVGDQLRLDLSAKFDDMENINNLVIVPVAGITKVVAQSLVYAKSLSDDVIAVYVGSSPEEIDRMEKKWEKWQTGVKLVTIFSLYRSVTAPLSEFIDTVKEKTDQSGTKVTGIMPQFITKKWWHSFLHNQTGFFILARLLRKKCVNITIVPYQLEK